MSGPIVVGFDGHAASGRALDRAIADAKTAHTRLVIVMVEESPVAAPNVAPTSAMEPPAAVMAPSSPPPPPRRQVLREQAVQRAGSQGVVADIVWNFGDAIRANIDATQDQLASAIVLGAHYQAPPAARSGASRAASRSPRPTALTVTRPNASLNRSTTESRRSENTLSGSGGNRAAPPARPGHAKQTERSAADSRNDPSPALITPVRGQTTIFDPLSESCSSRTGEVPFVQ